MKEDRFKVHYIVKGWNGAEHHLTAKQFYDQVIADSKKSNYNWIASASEIVKICGIPGFPALYAQDIKIAILNCFTALTQTPTDESYLGPTDIAAVHWCYNSLTLTKAARAARTAYLKAFITLARKSCSNIPLYSGSAYVEFCEAWETKKLSELSEVPIIDFLALSDKLKADFAYKENAANVQNAFKSI